MTADFASFDGDALAASIAASFAKIRASCGSIPAHVEEEVVDAIADSLRVIEELIETRGCGPTPDELADELDLSGRHCGQMLAIVLHDAGMALYSRASGRITDVLTPVEPITECEVRLMRQPAPEDLPEEDSPG